MSQASQGPAATAISREDGADGTEADAAGGERAPRVRVAAAADEIAQATTDRSMGAVATNPQGSHDPGAPPRAVFIECPGFEQMVSHSHRIGEVMDEVARYYHADLCILTWREQGRLCFKAGDRMGTIDVPRRRPCRYSSDYHLFNHVISRELPIIIPDVQQDEAYRTVTLPLPFTSPVRFYAAAPLIRAPCTFIGTLCIIDFTRPRANFQMSVTDFLVERANELVTIAERAMSFFES
jgi:hypothetical protein